MVAQSKCDQSAIQVQATNIKSLSHTHRFTDTHMHACHETNARAQVRRHRPRQGLTSRRTQHTFEYVHKLWC